MKVLSVKQPWAYLLVSGIKDIENRPRRTHFRGRILIHASAKADVKREDFSHALNYTSMELSQCGGKLKNGWIKFYLRTICNYRLS